MPSGAKKRKAAKKKKEKEANINPSSPRGIDDLKSQDEKGSDGGEVSSPAHHDHNHHHPFVEGNEDEVDERVPSAAQRTVTDVKFLEEVLSDITSARVVEEKEDSVVKIESDLNSEESFDTKNVGVELIESAKESYDGNRKSSSTPNDESLTQKNSKDASYNLVQDTIAYDGLVKSIDSPPAKMTLITENAPFRENGNSIVVESSVNSVKALAAVSEVKSNDTGSPLLDKSVVQQEGMTDLVMKKNEDTGYPLSGENLRTSSVEEPWPKEYDSKVSVSLSGAPFTESTNGGKHAKDSETPECSEYQPLAPSAPCMVQKTSWLSCCGLFEVLSCSNG